MSEAKAVEEYEEEEEEAPAKPGGVKFRLIPLEEAKDTRKPKIQGARAQRMGEFATYAQHLIDNPEAAAVYEGDEVGQKFVLSLRGAFTRAGVNAIVRKMRGRNEVRAWLPTQTPGTDPEAITPEDAAAIAAAEAALTPAPSEQPQRRRKVSA